MADILNKRFVWKSKVVLGTKIILGKSTDFPNKKFVATELFKTNTCFFFRSEQFLKSDFPIKDRFLILTANIL